MIEYLLLLLAIKHRDCFSLQRQEAQPDYLDRCLEPGAGLDYDPAEPHPVRKRPDLRIV